MKFINFNIIYNDIWKSQLQNLLGEHWTIHKNDFDRYAQQLKYEMVSAGHGSEHKNVFFEKDLDKKHFFEKYRHVELSPIKKDLGKNNQLM